MLLGSVFSAFYFSYSLDVRFPFFFHIIFFCFHTLPSFPHVPFLWPSLSVFLVPLALRSLSRVLYFFFSNIGLAFLL